MSSTELVQIQPRELKFIFEVKKQSSCSVHLLNRSDEYVAFKVKTTSPKKYCVRPNTGVIKPNDTRDFAVTMQAQKVAPPDLLCKDKFLVQTIVVPFGTMEEEITSAMFSKDSGKYIEEKKLRVVLLSPPQSPVLLPNNGELRNDPCIDTSLYGDVAANGIENIPPPCKLSEDILDFEASKGGTDEYKAANDIDLKPSNNIELKSNKDTIEPKLAKEYEELKSKLLEINSKLTEADHTIMKLTEESSIASREKEMLMQEVEVLRRKKNSRRIQVGFPLLYVCMVALISMAIGYFTHS